MGYIIEYGKMKFVKRYWIELKTENGNIYIYLIFGTKKELKEKIRYYKNMYQIEKIIENL